MNKLFPLLIAITMLIASCSKDNSVPGGSGLIEANDVIVSSEVAGRILAIEYGEGDLINKNAVICTIDTVSYSLRLNQALALKKAAQTQIEVANLNVDQATVNYKLAEKEYDRGKRLIESNSINQQQYDKIDNGYRMAGIAMKQAEAALGAAKADLEKVSAEIAILRETLANCTPVAPIAGRIVQKYIDAGELTSPGKGIVKIASLDTVWVKVYLAPTDLTKIKLGGTAKVDLEDDNATILDGTISWISSEAEFTPKNIQTKEARADLVYAVKILIPNENEVLKIGMPVSVTIP